MTLFEKFDGILSKELVDKLGGLSERKLGDTEEAIRAIFYTLLAGLIRRANSDMNTNLLLNQVEKITSKDYANLDVDKALSTKEGLLKLVEIGNQNMSQVFPSFKSQLINLITAYCGSSKEETANYTAFVNAMIIRFLHEEIEKGMDKDDLMNYLKAHRDPLFDVAPENLVEKMIPALGMHELRSMKLTYARKQEEKIAAKKELKAAEALDEEPVSYEEESSRGGVGKILLILTVIALAGVLGYLIYDSREDLFGKSESQSTEVLVEDLPEMVLDSTSSADTAIVDTHPGVSALLEVLRAPQLDPALEIRLESLAFGPDSSEFRAADYAVVDTLLAEFKRNPRFQIQVRGGDSKGNSQNAIRRAFHLKRLLQNKGVDPIRIDATADTENLDYLKIRVVSK